MKQASIAGNLVLSQYGEEPLQSGEASQAEPWGKPASTQMPITPILYFPTAHFSTLMEILIFGCYDNTNAEARSGSVAIFAVDRSMKHDEVKAPCLLTEL